MWPLVCNSSHGLRFCCKRSSVSLVSGSGLDLHQLPSRLYLLSNPSGHTLGFLFTLLRIRLRGSLTFIHYVSILDANPRVLQHHDGLQWLGKFGWPGLFPFFPIISNDLSFLVEVASNGVRRQSYALCPIRSYPAQNVGNFLYNNTWKKSFPLGPSQTPSRIDLLRSSSTQTLMNFPMLKVLTWLSNFNDCPILLAIAQIDYRL